MVCSKPVVDAVGPQVNSRAEKISFLKTVSKIVIGLVAAGAVVGGQLSKAAAAVPECIGIECDCMG